MSDRPFVLCLLPVRNGAALLPGWFESVERFADAVIALDDGSTDDTRTVLESHPLVVDVIDNPRRSGYAGWDDAANRSRLLDRAERHRPTWIMGLDTDERLDEGDGRALRTFLERDAVPGLAYGFRVHRMIESVEAYDRSSLWVYRLFAHEPDQRFPSTRLHFVPIPTSIPQRSWVKTSIRIQHLASLTDDHRQRRYQKYLEADADIAFQAGYERLLDGPDALRRWEPRPPGQPVLVDPRSARAEDVELPDDRPILSAIVISRNDEARIERCVRSVVEQQVPVPFEVIVVTSGTDRTADIVRRAFPQVHVVELDRPALPGRARNAGLEVARGDYISFPGSHVELPPGSLAARVAAHERGWAMVTGTTLNGNDTFAGWASYFLDHSTVLPGRPATELAFPPAHCSYRASLLLDVNGFPGDRRTGEDTVVNSELFRRGHSAYRDPAVRLIHSSPSRTVPALMRHHFGRGQGLARIILDDRRPPGVLRDRRFLRTLGPRYVIRRVRRTDKNVREWGGKLAPVYGRVRAGVLAGAVSAWFGAWYELLRPREGWRTSLLAKAPAASRSTEEAELATESVVVRGLTTGYCPCSICCGEWADGITAMLVDTATTVMGASADFGLLPPGTVIHVDGYGTVVVDDTGGAMRSAAKRGVLHLDIRFATHAEGLEWGARWVDVTVPASTRAAALANEPELGAVFATGTR